MKILHTADWHIGKKLYKYDLYADFELFTDWLVALIQQENIEVLLVSGDVFDLANPSNEARKQFYASLIKIQKLGCKIILTAGNHDSPAVLNTSKIVLEELQINVVPALPENISELIFPLQQGKKVQAVVAAIPFLRDAELRKASDGISYQERIEAIQQGIKNVYFQVKTYCQTHFPDVPIIAMGHLFATGEIAASDSEREIQLGNAARFDMNEIGADFQYIALGHIHKPQRLKTSVPAFYSGSPIALSFSERKDQKRVLLIDTEKGFEPQSIEVPMFRRLIRLRGNLQQLSEKLRNLPKNDTPLDALLEIQWVEPVYSAQAEDQFNEMIQHFSLPNYQIAKVKMEFQDRVQGLSQLLQEHQDLSQISPFQVFKELLLSQPLEEQTHSELLAAFSELWEEAAQQVG